MRRGERTCADRWQALEPLVASGSSLLDVGAHSGYFAIRAAELGCDATAVDDHRALRAAAREGVRVIDRRLSPAELDDLPRVDVVLALSVLHHFDDWRAALQALRRCRRWLIAEVPDPGERWMRRAPARHELDVLHAAVHELAVAELGRFPREHEGEGEGWWRPMLLIKGTVRRLHGRVFAGSGWCARNMPRFDPGIERLLGYEPYPGSLNLRFARRPRLGFPMVWHGRGRPRWLWRAWVGGLRCHASVPVGRDHGKDVLELLAPVRLRDHLSVGDGEEVAVDVETRWYG